MKNRIELVEELYFAQKDALYQTEGRIMRIKNDLATEQYNLEQANKRLDKLEKELNEAKKEDTN